jgi:hypothetical protein
MTNNHKAVSKSEIRCFSGAIGSAARRGDENPVAHGGNSYTEFCACGAERLVNENAGQYEIGDWYVPDEE